VREAAAPQPLTAELTGDPAGGRSALDRKKAIAELNIVDYLDRKGHQCRALPSGTQFMIDGKIVDLKNAIELLNKYRSRANLAPIDLRRFA